MMALIMEQIYFSSYPVLLFDVLIMTTSVQTTFGVLFLISEACMETLYLSLTWRASPVSVCFMLLLENVPLTVEIMEQVDVDDRRNQLSVSWPHDTLKPGILM